MKYTDSHEWIELQGPVGTVGVTYHAQKELGDIVFVELPTVGKTVKKGLEVAVLESTKAAADVYSPLSGTILEVNEKLKEEAGLINVSPEKEGWLYKIKLSDPAEMDKLLDLSEYQLLIKT